MKDLLARLNLDAIADLIRAGRAAESAATALLHAQPANVEPAPEYREPTLEDVANAWDRGSVEGSVCLAELLAALRAGGFVVREERK